MPRGGRRRGRPGVAYPQRVDLNAGPRKQLPVQTAPSTGYGERVAQERAQQAVPLAPPPSVQAAAAAQAQQPPPPPPDFGDFTRATERPEEPMTSGAALGPGPGPGALGMAGLPDTNSLWVRQLYALSPSEELRDLIEEIESGG